MIKIEARHYGPVYDLYRSGEFFFPLIGAVLLDRQDGSVYVDNPDSPSQAYVEHAFGFAQIFGARRDGFEADLARHLLVDKSFDAPKVRLYAPNAPDFLNGHDHASLRSYRQRFELAARETFLIKEPIEGASFKRIDAQNVELIEQSFGVVTRFWRNAGDFIEQSNAVVVTMNGQPAAICYAAAEADRFVEIDVMTAPAYRRLGLGVMAVGEFLNVCRCKSLVPLWDCFTNNEPSMALCKAAGFRAPGAPYEFYTIPR